MRSLALASSVRKSSSLALRASIRAAALVLSAAAFAQGTRVTPPLVGGGSISTSINSWKVSADGSRVFYSVAQVMPGTIEIFDVPLDGSQASRALSAPLGAGRSCINDFFVLSPDEGHLLYVADQDTDEQFELYSVPTDGSRVSTKLSGSIAPNADVSPSANIVWTPDGTRVLFYVSQAGYYSALADGSQPPVLLTTLSSDQTKVTPDSSRVLFLRNQLYTVPIDGSAPAQLLATFPYAQYVTSFALTSDGSTAVFNGVRYPYFQEDILYRAPVDASAPPVAILGPLSTMQNGAGYFELTPDTTRAVYWSVEQQLYSVRVDGLEPGQLNPVYPANLVMGIDVSPDGSTVVFGCRGALGNLGVFSVPTDHSAGVSLLGGPVPWFFFPAPVAGADRALFMAPAKRISSAPLDASEPSVQLNGPLVSGGGVFNFDLSPDKRWAVYTADQDIANARDIYSVPIDGRWPARRLNPPLLTGRRVSHFRFAPGSDFVVYRADQETTNVFALYMSQYKGFGLHPEQTSKPTTPAELTR